MHFVNRFHFFFSIFFVGNSFNEINPVVPRWSRHYRVDPIETVSYKKKLEERKKNETLQVNWQMHFVGLKEIQLKIDISHGRTQFDSGQAGVK